jgi:hypothetical protein
MSDMAESHKGCFGTFACSQKPPVSYIVSTFKCISSSSTQQISVKFDVWDFIKNLPGKPILGCNKNFQALYAKT